MKTSNLIVKTALIILLFTASLRYDVEAMKNKI